VKTRDCIIEMDVGEQKLYVRVGLSGVENLKDHISPTAKISIMDFLKEVKLVLLEE
jgi:hypothetical protein